MVESLLEDREHVSLCEALDRILNKGAVVVGEVVISVANVDLIYLALQLVLTSIDGARAKADEAAAGGKGDVGVVHIAMWGEAQG